MTTTHTDPFDFAALIATAEADLARREGERERRELLDAEAEEREALAQIAELQRTGRELPVWAFEFLDRA
ncbi:hypothetical protein HQ346_16625 [Rhodococcus sp. BP-252]|uniref:hypothetical protein n=1 Tax=unclassified Rhodococcus (in: high G+C Gram-positive bacteria) TaxID=192944 RepID=UPI001C9B39BD|nr:MULTISPECIES: hypothetical protein [unclassified Rhodococcus (in: high G+C Gram-positive bacteria)]MBY6413321.1 hypothetical protein [Rhodococcus sp. BP-320]MBY6418075.1 hypothetical protein [Rhodococcus sp. BP-321]MBY6422235.1 hypothetical protein [Rhodococcus sp. BP-324]MBY6428124.1 hypothetical protein [Rhodococcus sp. BP-323]MBY6433242.1 hypothetical protein [Rhodococcus sp. BP-322]